MHYRTGNVQISSKYKRIRNSLNGNRDSKWIYIVEISMLVKSNKLKEQNNKNQSSIPEVTGTDEALALAQLG